VIPINWQAIATIELGALSIMMLAIIIGTATAYMHVTKDKRLLKGIFTAKILYYSLARYFFDKIQCTAKAHYYLKEILREDCAYKLQISKKFIP